MSFLQLRTSIRQVRRIEEANGGRQIHKPVSGWSLDLNLATQVLSKIRSRRLERMMAKLIEEAPN